LISKTVETYYEREHFWEINKWVDTEYGHTVEDDIPKIWLLEDGSGDEWATWHVCVDYMGYEDSGMSVSGFVTIENVGTSDAVILSVEDLLCGAPIDVMFGVEFPYVLPAGDGMAGAYYADVAAPIDCVNEVIVTTEVDVYGTSEPVIWGEPHVEINECVDIEDMSDLFGLQYLGMLCAPDSGCFIYDAYFAWTDYVAPGPYDYLNTATIVQTGQSADAILRVNWEEPPGDEGCTPGFWKNNAKNWGAVAWYTYTPDDCFGCVFGCGPHITLLEALELKGGGENALIRHAVAALLNAESPWIAYADSSGDIMSSTCAALASGDKDIIEDLKDQFDEWNNAGCSVDQHGIPINGIVV
jgi:hypothetical protein